MSDKETNNGETESKAGADVNVKLTIAGKEKENNEKDEFFESFKAELEKSLESEDIEYEPITPQNFEEYAGKVLAKRKLNSRENAEARAGLEAGSPASGQSRLIGSGEQPSGSTYQDDDTPLSWREYEDYGEMIKDLSQIAKESQDPEQKREARAYLRKLMQKTRGKLDFTVTNPVKYFLGKEKLKVKKGRDD